MEIKIPVPSTFSFRRTVISHGWCELLPFAVDREKWRLTRVIDLVERAPVTVTMNATKRSVRLITSRVLSKRETSEVVSATRHILRLDDDLDHFYRATNADVEFEWIARQGAGRMLRSPTVFEDLVKMICTTNCSWALTQKMVTGLVQNLGREAKDGGRTFPTPEAMALMPVNVEEWLASPLTTADLVKQIKSVKGAGDYAAENLLKLLGRYDGLALDSWTRAKFFEVRNNGRKASDKKIARYYSRFKEWRGLVLWCDMTRDWLDGENAT